MGHIRLSHGEVDIMINDNNNSWDTLPKERENVIYIRVYQMNRQTYNRFDNISNNIKQYDILL